MAATNRTDKVYIEAYDKDDRQVLGTLDGQGVLPLVGYKRSIHYKELAFFPTLDRVVKYYKIVNRKGTTIEIVDNFTHKDYTVPTSLKDKIKGRGV